MSSVSANSNYQFLCILNFRPYTVIFDRIMWHKNWYIYQRDFLTYAVCVVETWLVYIYEESHLPMSKWMDATPNKIWTDSAGRYTNVKEDANHWQPFKVITKVTITEKKLSHKKTTFKIRYEKKQNTMKNIWDKQLIWG